MASDDFGACSRRVAVISVLGALLPSHGLTAEIATFPTRTIRLVVPYPAGGVVDSVARHLSKRLAVRLRQPIFVDNRSGAGGTIGTSELAKSPADGYTIGLIYDSHAVSRLFYPHATFDPLNDFAFVTRLVTSPMVLVAQSSLGVGSLKELLAHAKAHPGTLNYGSPASGSSNHLVMEQLKLATGLDAKHIPYKGGAPIFADILGGSLQLVFANSGTVAPFVRSGRMKALAVSSAERSSVLPDVPTLEELGVRGFDVRSWVGMAAPVHTPAAIVDMLSTTVTAALREPSMGKGMADLGFEVVGGSPRAFEQLVREDSARWERVVRDARIRIE